MNIQKIFRLPLFVLLAIWSASTMAKDSYTVMESDDQRLAFSQLLGAYQTDVYSTFTPNRADKPGILAHLTHGMLNLNWRFDRVPTTSLERPPPNEYRQAIAVHPTPAIKLDFSGSSIEFHRKGLRYQPKKTSAFFDLSYRNLNHNPKLVPDKKEDPTSTKGIRLGFGFTF